MASNLPFSEACEQNKHPILAVLKEQLHAAQTVLEIGSGTGQHAVFFASKLSHLQWQPSDLRANIAGISARIAHNECKNVLPPLELDVASPLWPVTSASTVFSANGIHIMSWHHVIALFSGLDKIAASESLLILYGPFNYAQNYTSESNREFDNFLRSRDPQSGIRNFEDVDELANAAGFKLQKDYPMPANNRILVWRKSATG